MPKPRKPRHYPSTEHLPKPTGRRMSRLEVLEATRKSRFVREFLKDHRAIEAAERAGYSAKTANNQGYQLLRDPVIQAQIRHAMALQADRTAITADRVLLELATIAFANPEHYQLAPDGASLTRAPDAPYNAMGAISSIKVKTRLIPNGDDPPIREHELEYRFWNKIEALKALGQHLGILRDDLQGNALSDVLLTVLQEWQAKPMPQTPDAAAPPALADPNTLDAVFEEMSESGEVAHGEEETA